jgi:hypothetical protein
MPSYGEAKKKKKIFTIQKKIRLISDVKEKGLLLDIILRIEYTFLVSNYLFS